MFKTKEPFRLVMASFFSHIYQKTILSRVNLLKKNVLAGCVIEKTNI